MNRFYQLVVLIILNLGVAHANVQPSMLDFSYCGYHQSETTIPNAQNVVFVGNIPGDNYQRIQNAVDYVSGLKPDKKTGLRGAVLIGEGTFEISQPIKISASGVIIRGTGREKTIIRKMGVDRGSAIYIEGRNDLKIIDTLDIVTPYVAVNKHQFTVSSGGILKKGEDIMIFRPSTKEWIQSVKCDIFGGGLDWLGWKPSDIDIKWSRKIVSVDGKNVIIDAPLTVALDKKWGDCKILRYKWSGRISESGVENLTIESDYDKKYPKDEDHCWNGIYISAAKDCWVRQVFFKNMAGSAVIVQRTGQQITVEDCISYNPVSEIGGFRRCTFYTLGEKCLFQRCYSVKGINDFCAGYCAPGPNAFVQCDSQESLGFSGSVSSWATGLLFDIVNIDGNDLKFTNLGQDKFGAGWNTANSTFWQCTASELYCSSPSEDAKNYAVGCWGQFEGDGEWSESNNHVQPRSLYYDLLKKRLGHDIDAQSRILPRNTDASSNPSLEEAAKMAKEALTVPRLTLENWIKDATFSASVSPLGLKSIEKTKNDIALTEVKHSFEVKNGKLLMDDMLIVGGKHNTPWWAGRIKDNWLPQASYALTRFVPGREGYGLTDNIDSVVAQMKRENTSVFSQNYGLWYDLRRDDHERIRRRDGDVWAPFYEQAFARCGEGIAWDGLSKYDLNKLNKWYFYRLKQFAEKGEDKGLLLFNEHYFQHNILEAGAHWVDCPWRTVNNINNTRFPEPVPFTGDKRLFMAEYFYNENDSIRRKLHKNYIMNILDQFADNPNVIHSIGEEFTGPLHFVRFWVDCVREWEQKTGKHPLIALAVNKNVEDSILCDKERSKVIDIIDIEQWFYHSKGLYSPDGGANIAPRQYLRKARLGSIRFEDVYKSVLEYTTKYPNKAVVYYAQKFPEMCWAVIMAGGSCPAIPVSDRTFLKDIAKMVPIVCHNGDGVVDSYQLLDERTGTLLYNNSNKQVQFNVPSGSYSIRTINPLTGNIKSEGTIKIREGIYKTVDKRIIWLKRL